MSLPADTLVDLRRKLPVGWQKLVLEELHRKGITRSKGTLSNNLAGSSFDVDVMNAIVLVANNHQNVLRQVQERIANIPQVSAA